MQNALISEIRNVGSSNTLRCEITIAKDFSFFSFFSSKIFFFLFLCKNESRIIDAVIAVK